MVESGLTERQIESRSGWKGVGRVSRIPSLRASTGASPLPFAFCVFVPFVAHCVFVPLNWLSPVVPRSWLNSRLPSPVLLLAALCVLTAARVEAQQELEPRQLVESPTAGLLPGGSLGVDFRFYEGDGILGHLSVGMFGRGMAGISFGGRDLLGEDAVSLNPRVEFSARVRVLEEGYKMPGIAVGYASQGYGTYDEELKRYTKKSKGVYVVASKNFMWFAGHTGIHVGANRSFEDDDGDDTVTGYVGVDVGLGRYAMLLAEYDLGLNDNADNSLGSGKGFLNAGLRVAASGSFAVEFDLKNIFRNGMREPHPDRELRVVYFVKF